MGNRLLLPDDLKAVIDANSAAAIAGEVGQVWDGVEVPGKEAVLGSGSELVELDPEAMAAFDERAEQVTAQWIADMAEQGIDGQALVDAARSAVAAHTR